MTARELSQILDRHTTSPAVHNLVDDYREIDRERIAAMGEVDQFQRLTRALIDAHADQNAEQVAAIMCSLIGLADKNYQPEMDDAFTLYLKGEIAALRGRVAELESGVPA